MSERPISVSQGVFEVIRDAGRPLFLAQIIEQVGALPLKSGASLRRAVQSALRRSPQIVAARSGAYVLASYLLKGAVFRHPLTGDEIADGRLTLHADARFALAPFSFDARSRWDVRPTQLALENGPVLMGTVRPLDDGTWGLPPFPALGDWYQTLRCRPGDPLLVEVLDGEARLCHLWPGRGKSRGDERIAERDRCVADEAFRVLSERSRPLPMGRLIASLVAQGLYHNPIPADPIEHVLQRDRRFALANGRVSLVIGAADEPPIAVGFPVPVRTVPARAGWLQRLFHRHSVDASP